ncbi:MAG: hypothetical protein MK041_13355, partial [Aquabacterium sp.]|nr:hypothetical protein [Aquabacterium sp.]
ANDAITNEKIVDDAITTNKIQDGQVQTDDLENLTVTNGKIAANAITTEKIGNGEVLNEDLDKANIPLSGFGAAEADIDIGSNRLINVTDPTDLQDAATKNYVDNSIDADNDLPRGNIFVGDATDEAVALDANDDGKILIGDGTDLNSVGVSGDVLIDNTGATEIQDNSVQGDDIDVTSADFVVTGNRQVILQNTDGFNVTNAVDFDDNLNVDGQVDLSSAGSQTNVRGELNVTENTNLSSDLTVDGNATVNSNTNLNGNLTVDGTIFSLDASDPSNVSVTGNDLTVSTNNSGDVRIEAADSIILDAQNIGITGTFAPDNLNVDGLTQLDETQINTTDGDLLVEGSGSVNIDVPVDISSQTDLAASGVATNVRGDLNVSEQATFTENIDANNGLDVSGSDLTVATNTDLNGTLDVAGQTDLAASGTSTNIRGDLNVSEQATFTENIDANNGLDVSGSDLTVATNTDLNGNLTLDATNFSLDATDPSNVTVDGNDLTISTTTSGDVRIEAADSIILDATDIGVNGTFAPDNLSVDGLTQLDETQINTTDGNLLVNGSGTVDIDVPVDIDSQVDLAGSGVSTNVRGDLNVSEQATFTENIDANNGLDIAGSDLT